jgi:hypothetical protein
MDPEPVDKRSVCAFRVSLSTGTPPPIEILGIIPENSMKLMRMNLVCRKKNPNGVQGCAAICRNKAVSDFGSR